MKWYPFLLLLTLFSCTNSDNTNAPEKNKKLKENATGTVNNEFKLNKDYSLKIATTRIHQPAEMDSRPNGITGQELSFLFKDSIIISTSIDSITVLENWKGKRTGYSVARVGTDSQNEVYVIHCYVANGEPEYYLFYNKNGKLVFSKQCSGKKCISRIHLRGCTKEFVDRCESDTTAELVDAF